MKLALYFYLFFFFNLSIQSQVVLNANGVTDTYTLINSVLALPNKNVIEVPDCIHTAFGSHITQTFDSELNKYVFQFHTHVSPDNDRCIAFDRQRTEIKSYDGSPENLKAIIGETIEYKWMFKISDDFQPSSNFTHIHQIKSVGGDYESIPMITLTLRKSNPDRLELRYTPTNNQTTLNTANLDLFRGTWVTVKETIKFSETGTYSIEIKKHSDNQILFSYNNTSIDTWQDGAEFARPKWGIYRSLINKQDLKDEIVEFADFSIEEITGSLSINDLKARSENIVLFPNPASKTVEFKNGSSNNFDSVEIYDFVGRKVGLENRFSENKLDVSGLSKGQYFVVLKKDTLTVKVLKCLIK